jgi:hypothetical protein
MNAGPLQTSGKRGKTWGMSLLSTWRAASSFRLITCVRSLPVSSGLNSAMSRFDVIVIGAGLTGSCAAKELACGGLKVALLDAGPLLQEELFRPPSPGPNPTSSFSQFHRLRLLLTGERKKALNTAAQKQTHEFFASTSHPIAGRCSSTSTAPAARSRSEDRVTT